MLYKEAVTTNVCVVEPRELDKTASTKLQKYHPDCIYLRTRAIGNLEVDGPNANADAFPYAEFINTKPGYGYQSFVGKKAFVEHQSDSVTNAIGDLVDSYLREFNLGTLSSKAWYDLNDDERISVIGSHLRGRNNGEELIKAYSVQNLIDKQADGSIEVLMKIDRARAPQIARQVDIGEKVGVSMGTAISYSDCSVCGNKARYEQDYCEHVAYGKGRHHPVRASDMHKLVKAGTVRPEWLVHTFESPNEVKAVLLNENRTVYAKSYEINYGLQFYELSVVANPAFDRGYMLDKVANKTDENLAWLKQIDDNTLLSLYKSLS